MTASEVAFESSWDDEGEVTMVQVGERSRRSDTYIVTRLGNFHGLSNDAIVMLAQIEDGI